jgi:thiamine biosynthesis protein ThiI
MQLIVRLHPEIIIKSRRVRKRFTFLLDGNIDRIFKGNQLSVEVIFSWDKLTLPVDPKNALVTGECLGQVSGQTLTNLSVIDKATDKLILRPLICMDKMEIIAQAKHIGTEDFAKIMPEYCGVISSKPTVKAQLDKIEVEESKLDFNIIERVVAEAKMRDILSIAEAAAQQTQHISNVKVLPQDCVVLDIRSTQEQEEAPLL